MPLPQQTDKPRPKRSRILRDASGHFDLAEVHSVTPYKVRLTDKDGKLIAGEAGEGAVAQLHFDSGHSMTTATPYDEVVDAVDEVNDWPDEESDPASAPGQRR